MYATGESLVSRLESQARQQGRTSMRRVGRLAAFSEHGKDQAWLTFMF